VCLANEPISQLDGNRIFLQRRSETKSTPPAHEPNSRTAGRLANAPLDRLTLVNQRAAAGLLQQIFAVDVTNASITCVGCESVQPLASLRLYGLPMGYILTCPQCHATLIRAAAHRQECWLDFRGVSTLHLKIE